MRGTPASLSAVAALVVGLAGGLLLLRTAHGVTVSTASISTPHLIITPLVHDEADAGFALVLDVAPREGIRVFAPGTSEFLRPSLTTASTPEVRVEQPVFPSGQLVASQGVTGESLVYARTFEVVQRAFLEPPSSADESVRSEKTTNVAGTFSYQACTEQVCFPPATVPVSWTVTLR